MKIFMHFCVHIEQKSLNNYRNEIFFLDKSGRENLTNHAMSSIQFPKILQFSK
jgi:hypothetical protein